MSAADRIRQAIEALPFPLCGYRWTPQGEYISTGHGRPFAGQTWEDDDHAPVAAYVALMDPTVGAALADLLEAIRAEHDRAHPADCDDVWPICANAHALEQAIERSQP